jgi:hypothetical protein
VSAGCQDSSVTPANCLLRACEMEIRCSVEANSKSSEILHLLTNFREYFDDCVVGYKIFCDCVAAMIE